MFFLFLLKGGAVGYTTTWSDPTCSRAGLYVDATEHSAAIHGCCKGCCRKSHFLFVTL